MRFLSSFSLYCSLLPAFAQNDTVLLHERGSFTFSTPYHSALSSQLDRNGAPVLYAACMEHGLVTFSIADVDAPVPIDTIPVSAFGGLSVGNVTQYGDRLYVPLGGPLGGTEHAGLGIVDVSIPQEPSVIAFWDSAAWDNGSAIVRVVNGMAYLGAMSEGLIVLDVNDPLNIHFVSHYLPDVSWPGINSNAPNARGMEIVGDVLFLTFDGGALRAIDISTPEAPAEIGHHVNPQQPPFTPVAYNNLRVVNDHAFIALDYCGVEVVNVSDPAAMQQVAWLNPWNCIGFSWFGSDGHTNEVLTAMNDTLLLLSGGDSEVLIYDISAPATPTLVGGYIHPNDSAAAWGIDLRDSLLAVNYVYNAGLPLQPYYSARGGVQLFTWGMDLVTTIHADGGHRSSPRIAPNPSTGMVRVYFNGTEHRGNSSVYDMLGRPLLHRPFAGSAMELDLSALGPGVRYLVLEEEGGMRWTERIVIER